MEQCVLIAIAVFDCVCVRNGMGNKWQRAAQRGQAVLVLVFSAPAVAVWSPAERVGAGVEGRRIR